jgi:hypothetical protein
LPHHVRCSGSTPTPSSPDASRRRRAAPVPSVSVWPQLGAGGRGGYFRRRRQAELAQPVGEEAVSGAP